MAEATGLDHTEILAELVALDLAHNQGRSEKDIDDLTVLRLERPLYSRPLPLVKIPPARRQNSSTNGNATTSTAGRRAIVARGGSAAKTSKSPNGVAPAGASAHRGGERIGVQRIAEAPSRRRPSSEKGHRRVVARWSLGGPETRTKKKVPQPTTDKDRAFLRRRPCRDDDAPLEAALALLPDEIYEEPEAARRAGRAGRAGHRAGAARVGSARLRRVAGPEVRAGPPRARRSACRRRPP